MLAAVSGGGVGVDGDAGVVVEEPELGAVAPAVGAVDGGGCVGGGVVGPAFGEDALAVPGAVV